MWVRSYDNWEVLGLNFNRREGCIVGVPLICELLDDLWQRRDYIFVSFFYI